MESSVASHISSKLYTAEVSKLSKEDIEAQSELYEIQIFNNTLHIAPGNPIIDESGLVYMFVYAIKNEKVIANLGVFELLTDEPAKAYDLSTFETPLLLFDYYYTNPTKLKEFAIAENNIFDFIAKYLTQKYEPRITTLYKELNKFREESKKDKDFEPFAAVYKKMLQIMFEEMKTTGIDIKKIQKMKDLAINETNFKLILAMLEPFLQVRFMITHNGREVSNLREKVPVDFTPTQMIVVSLDQIFVSSKKFDAEDEAKAEDAPESKAEAKAESKAVSRALEEGEIEEGELGEISVPVKVSPVKVPPVKVSPVKEPLKVEDLDVGKSGLDEVEVETKPVKVSKKSKQKQSKEEKIEEMSRVIEEFKPNVDTKFSVMKAKAREQGIPLDNEEDKELFKDLIGDYLSKENASEAQSVEAQTVEAPTIKKSKIAAPSGVNVKPKLSKISEADSKAESKAERSERSEKGEKAEKAVKGAKSEKGSKSEKAEKAASKPESKTKSKTTTSVASP